MPFVKTEGVRMFTGIIREVGTVKKIERKSSLWKIGIASEVIRQEAGEGDSISVNGVCLTVVENKNTCLFFEAVKPTLAISSLKRLRTGSFVNLEPSLAVGDKLGGHFVLGHIDCEGRVKRITKQKNYSLWEISVPAKFKKFAIEKGSIAIEGISLTIASCSVNSLKVNIIPYTLAHTNLCKKHAGEWVNIEFDYLLKKRA